MQCPRLSQIGMQLLERDGLMMSCSCSYHMPERWALAGIRSAVRHLDRDAQAFERGGQAADYPAIPENRAI